MIVSVLASGSKGNATVVTEGESSILIDAGISVSRVFQQMRTFGLDPANLKAILITHAHGDHNAYSDAISTKLRIPVICTAGTAEDCDWGSLSDPQLIPRDGIFEVDEFQCCAIKVPHDASDPVAFAIRTNLTHGKQFGYFMDMGYITEEAASVATCCDGLFIESNHDIELLKESKMEPQVKKRVMSEYGHLSNQAVCDLSNYCLRGSKLKRLVLGHLSAGANDPGLIKMQVNPHQAVLDIVPHGGTFQFEI